MFPRRAIRDTSQRRRHEGLSPLEIESFQEAMEMVGSLLQLAIMVPIGPLRNIYTACSGLAVDLIETASHVAYRALDHVDPTNKNRLLSSFTEEECWDFFRFRKYQLAELVGLLRLPLYFTCPESRHTCPGEHALLLYLYHLSYPTKLQRMQNVFERELSQLSRLENRVKAFLILRNQHKVLGNLDWYANRFGM